MTAQRLDDYHPSLIGNGTFGNMEIVNGGLLTLTVDSSLELFNFHGHTSGAFTVTVDAGQLLNTHATKRFTAARTGDQGATCSLDSGTIDITGRISEEDGSGARGEMNLNGGTFTLGKPFIVAIHGV